MKFKLDKEENTLLLLFDDGKSLLVSVYEQYSQFWKRCNWYTFDFFTFEFEWDKIMGGLAVELCILGFYLILRFTYTKTEEMIKIEKQVEEIKNGTAQLEECFED